MVDAVAAVTQAVNYTPYGVPDTSIIGPAFTGEWRDESEVQYHRARYLSPNLGTFLSLDPFEGMASRPMSLNGYNWVEGQVVNGIDPSGKILESPATWNTCLQDTIPTPMPVPAAPAPETGSNQTILSSTVRITLIQRTSNCLTTQDVYQDIEDSRQNPTGPRACGSEGFSLGTIVTDGILTHDHYHLEEDAGRSGEAIHTAEWLYIAGENGFFVVPNTADVIVSNPSTGITKIVLPADYPLSEIGVAANIVPLSKQTTGTPILFPYDPNTTGGDLIPRNRTVVGEHYPRHERLRVGQLRLLGVGLCRTYEFLLDGWGASRGDSGGGHFNTRGNLVGVYRGADHYGILEPNCGQGNYFNPLRQAAALVMPPL